MKYTPEMIDYIMSVAVGNNTYNDVTSLFNKQFKTDVNTEAIGRLLRRYGVKLDFRTKYTAEMIQWLRDNVPSKYFHEIVSMFNEKFKTNHSNAQLRVICCNNGIKNGLHRGNKHNPTKYIVGSIIYERGYEYIKISDAGGNKRYKGTWKLKHHLIWEAAYGPIPIGYNVIFLDSNKSNFELDNLAVITKCGQNGGTRWKGASPG